MSVALVNPFGFQVVRADGTIDRGACGPLHITPFGEKLLAGFLRDLADDDPAVRFMAGSVANYASTKLGDLLFGKTAYAGETTLYAGLWAAALTSAFNGATGSECGYTSYARLANTNNATIFAAGTGTTGAYTKTFPSDATKSFATSTGTGTNNIATYLGILNGNAGTSGDKAVGWCSITPVTINNGDTPQLAQNATSAVFGA